MQYGIGVLGATGYIGTPYRKEIREAHDAEVKIVALCARRLNLLEDAGAEDGASLLTDQWEQVVEHPEVNLVLVLTPDALHENPVLAAAEAGKHVFCEKPVGLNSAQAYRMLKAVQSAGVRSFVPFWTRYVGAFARAREIVKSGRLGDIRAVMYRWHNPRPLSMPFTWRDDAAMSAAGSIADVGSHAYDTIRFILGVEADRVLAHTGVVMPAKPDLGNINLSEALEWGTANPADSAESRKKGTVPDYGLVAMQFPGGIVGSLIVSHASYLRKGFGPELELHGTDASLSIERVTGRMMFADSPEPARILETIPDVPCNRFQRFVFPALREVTESGQHPTLEDGYRVQVFTDAVVASARNSRWVELEEIAARSKKGQA